ncbi:GGDEF domain-containing protein [Novosphingobium pentaromativorans]|uniref:Diguanylate cyclase n=1 Tax=Novosphingobium pentaromativorans US6-1 TaxID=1088721 RepID=G6EGZ7_9SPHN|nr:diguanylate cyclase [Novosphingobium pentaromativorans]AIT82015.1 diguanylate cyclase [Novosphingobium pentaromativorans US6-1]EHJ59286.1 hypothetical protein NSU_3618 [Novosphingobium pentaromativorans US6-1]
MIHFHADAAIKDSTKAINDDRPDSLRLYEQAASLVPMGAWSCNLPSDELAWTGGVFDLFGLSPQDDIDRRLVLEMYDEESRELLEHKRSRAIETCSDFTLDARIVRPDGFERWIRITAATRAPNGRAEALYGMKQDVTEDRERWERLRLQAECDALTGVANRGRFQDFLDRGPLATGHRVGALLLFDLDGFKKINDWWGHAAGDACLAAFAERLRRAFPHASLISRIGGDEFAVLLPPAGPGSVSEAELRTVIGHLLLPVAWNGDLLPLGVSVGLAHAPVGSARETSAEIGFDPQALFLAADKALYEAKGDPALALVCA